MRNNKAYVNFDEIEDEVRKRAPSVVYKYRSWNTQEHKSLLQDKMAWFAHAFTLNDKEDLRHPYRINIAFYNSPMFYDKLKGLFGIAHPNFSVQELVSYTNKKWLEIQNDPIGYFTKNLNFIHNDYDFYRAYGVFSTGKSGLNERLWSEYGDNFQGYCIGFKTVDLARQLECVFGKVDYSDEAMELNLIDGFSIELARQEEFLKKTIWSYEDEYRFININDRTEERKKYFTDRAVAEIIIGHNALPKTQDEIVEIVKDRYSSSIPIYKTEMSANGITKTPL